MPDSFFWLILDPSQRVFLWWNLSKNVQKILLMNLSLPRLIWRDTVATSLNGLKDYLVHPIEPPEYDGLKSNYRCQFHKHFLSNFFIKNCYSNIFFANSLLMYFFCWKAAHKMLVKSATGCWKKSFKFEKNLPELTVFDLTFSHLSNLLSL